MYRIALNVALSFTRRQRSARAAHFLQGDAGDELGAIVARFARS
jgi:hypothetical protein